MGDEAFRKRAIVFATFVFLGSLIKLTQHGARDMHYSFLCPIVVISEAKLACSLVLYALYDGEIAQIPERLRKSRGVVIRYSAVAALFCTYDVLSFVNLANMDPQTYLVFLQLRTVLTGVVWELAFKKALSWMQRLGLAFICFGCIAKQTKGGFKLEASANVSLFEYVLLAVQIGANCLAGVANELLLKQKGSVPLNLQNAVQYSWTIVWCLLVGVLCPVEGLHLNPFDFGEWGKMLEPRMIPNIVILTILGLITAVMLKILNSVWKAVATAVELFLTSYASALIFGYPVHFSDVVALCIACSGVWLYTQTGVSKPAEKVEAVTSVVDASKDVV